MAIYSVEVLDAIEASEEGDTRPVTLENSAETDHPEVLAPGRCLWTERPSTEFADFSNCIHADKAVGEIDFRKRPRGYNHPKFIGKDAASKPAEYSAVLCRAYAKLVVAAWMQDVAPVVALPEPDGAAGVEIDP